MLWHLHKRVHWSEKASAHFGNTQNNSRDSVSNCSRPIPIKPHRNMEACMPHLKSLQLRCNLNPSGNIKMHLSCSTSLEICIVTVFPKSCSPTHGPIHKMFSDPKILTMATYTRLPI